MGDSVSSVLISGNHTHSGLHVCSQIVTVGYLSLSALSVRVQTREANGTCLVGRFIYVE